MTNLRIRLSACSITDLPSNRPFDFLNARFFAASRLSHELQDAFVERFLVHVFQPVAEKRQRFLLGDGGGERGVDEAV